jgi:hypothetical protein
MKTQILALLAASSFLGTGAFGSTLIVHCVGVDANQAIVTADISSRPYESLMGRIFSGTSKLFDGPAVAMSGSITGGASCVGNRCTQSPQVFVTNYVMESASTSGGGSCGIGVCTPDPSQSSESATTYNLQVTSAPGSKSAILTQDRTSESITLHCH